MIALSPLLSWFVVGMVLFITVVGYAALVAGGRADEWAEREWRARMGTIDVLPTVNVRPEDAPPSADFPIVRIFGGIYDHEASGDFNWSLDHDPTIDYDRCEACNTALRRAFNQLADRDLGPRDADVLMAAIRRVLDAPLLVALHEELEP